MYKSQYRLLFLRESNRSTALKTLALRLRGAKVELEEAGEDVDGMAESTSQLQAKLKALTHGKVDIMLDANTFKNTTQILREMSGAWEDMTDIERASALELMGGKRQANILASVIKNFDTVEDVIVTSMDSSGSAIAENEKVLDSIQGKINLFTNSLQTMWMNLIDSSIVKGVVDLGTVLVKLFDTIGVIPSALAGVALYFTAIKKNNPATVFKDLTSSIQQYNNTVRQIESINNIAAGGAGIGSMKMADFNAGPVNAYAAAVSNLSAKQQAATLAAQGLNSEQIAAVLGANNLEAANIRLAMSQAGVSQAVQTSTSVTGLQAAINIKQQGLTLSQNAANFLLANSTQEVTEEMLEKAVVAEKISQQEADMILKSGMLTAANTTQAFSWKALGVAIKSAFMSNPVGWILMIAGAVASLLPVLTDWIDKTEEIKEAANEAIDKYKEAESTLKSTKRTISEISGDYEKLAKGVDELGNNISLSTSEYERYNEIVNQIADMFPTMVKGYTDEGNAIIKNKGNVQALADAYAELQEKANVDLVMSGSSIMKNYQSTVQGTPFQFNKKTSDSIKAAKKLEEIFKNQESFDFSNFEYEYLEGTAYRSKEYDDIISLLGNAGISSNTHETHSEYVQRAMNEFPSIIQGIINQWNSTVNAAMSQVQPLVTAYLNTSLGYAGLTSEQKNMMNAIASNFDAEFFNQFKGDATKMYAELERIMANLSSANMDDSFAVTLDMQTKFNNGDLTYDEYKAQVDNFVNKLTELQEAGLLDEESVIALKAFFDIQPYDTQLNSAKELLNDEGDEQVGSVLTKSDLEIVDKYKEEWLELYGAEVPLEKLKELILEIREAAGEFSVVNMIDDFDTLQGAFSKLGDAYSDFKDNGIVTAEGLADISESFKNVDGFDKYISVLGDSKSSMEDVKNALSGLATEYLATSDVLNNLTEENEQFVISQLKAFGVTNAEEYIASIRNVQNAMAEQYDIDLSNYATVESMKKAISAELYNDIMSINDDQVESLAHKYGIDLSNFSSAEKAKTAIAIAQAKARALADKQSAESTAKQNANAKMNATTVKAGDIKGSGLLGTGFLAGNKLVGKTYEEVLAAYNSGEYNGKSWKGQVEKWINSVSKANSKDISSAYKEIQATYDKTIAELNDTYAKYQSLDDYVAKYNPKLSIDASKLGGPSSGKNNSGSENEFEKTFDWVEVRLEEINKQIDLMNAKLENTANYASKNNIIDDIIGYNKTKMANLLAGIQKYAEYAAGLLLDVPAQYRDAAQDGAIAISEFAGEADEKTVEAIEKYREWAQKVSDLKQQLEDVNAEIRELAIQKIDNIQDFGSAKTSIEDLQTEKLQNKVDLDETSGKITSAAYYEAMMENAGKKVEYWTPLLKDMQKEFDDAVASGALKVGSVYWYENLAKLYEVQAEIDAATIEFEEFQNAINDIYWDNFDQLINRLDYLKDETQSLIDLMDNKDMVVTPETDNGWTADQVEWTDEGLASLGLYAQQMEIAEYTAKQYGEEVAKLESNREQLIKDGIYSENEYIEKLEELKSAQYDSIEAYHSAQDAIVDLNKARIDAIKDGIEKEIDAYEELIDKKKEELSAEKDLYDFQKNANEQSKNIAEIERKLAALSNDTSMSAMAKKRQLEAELAEAKAEQEDMYYNRSIENQQNALDQELESFKEEKEAEIEKWEEYLTKVETVVADSLNIVQENANAIGETLTNKANEYNLSVSDAVLSPWRDGSLAVSDYQNTFDTAMSSTMDQLDLLKNKWQEVIDKMAEVGDATVNAINADNKQYVSATYKEPETSKSNTDTANTTTSTTTKQEEKPKYSTYTVKSGDSLSAIAKSKLGSTAKWKEIYELNKDVISNPNLIYPGQKIKIPQYAKGTVSLNKSGIVNIDELGEELVLRAQNGRLTYMEKGSGVVPADLTSNLMEWGKLDPSTMLDQNRPSINVPHIVNNEINIDMHIAEVVHIDHVDNDTLPDLTKAVRKEMDSYMLKVNNALRSKVR